MEQLDIGNPEIPIYEEIISLIEIIHELDLKENDTELEELIDTIEDYILTILPLYKDSEDYNTWVSYIKNLLEALLKGKESRVYKGVYDKLQELFLNKKRVI